MDQQVSQDYTESEIAQRRDDALRRALSTPPKRETHKPANSLEKPTIQKEKSN